jgi:hypothetical protein
VSVTKDPAEKLDGPNGRQKTERNTGRPMWSTQVFVLDDDGGEVITVTTAGEKPNVKVGQVVAVSKLEALPWATNGRNGVADLPRAFRTADLRLIHAATCSSRYSSWTCCGVRYWSPECRRLELYQNSMYRTTSRRAWSRVGYWVR